MVILLLTLLIGTGGLIAYIELALHPQPPHPADVSALDLNRQQIGTDFYRIGNNWLKKSDTGLWEMYLEGGAFERGVIAGKLCKELQLNQEQSFVEQIRKMIPSEMYLKFLRYFILFFNRNLDKHIPEEYKLEIYGFSLSAPAEFNFIGNGYERLLNYHAAHDIGHALQNLMLVGCSSFSVWDSRSADSSLMIGRNFDFYAGDRFAENKIVLFCNPDSGYKFFSVTWSGFSGVASGMNAAGLTVTINAARSEIPTASATPISILAREILQYASTIDEAYAIAGKRKTFVAESILIGSARDRKAAIIEKSPGRMALFTSDTDFILCTNHYQSALFSDDPDNVKNKEESTSVYRYKRLLEWMDSVPRFTPQVIASVLRDRKGLGNRNIGMGNEKALNQLIAHHSVIFKPTQKIAWVSAPPYQLGTYVAYDLGKLWDMLPGRTSHAEIYTPALNLPADTFLYSEEYRNYERYRQQKTRIQRASPGSLPDSALMAFPTLNPECYLTYMTLGDYYKRTGDCLKAQENYQTALSKEVATIPERLYLEKALHTCQNNKAKIKN